MEKERLLFKIELDKVIKGIDLKGIGTYKEKTVHKVIKNFLDFDQSHHEIKIGSFVADIFNGEEIFEVQTANFNTLRKKLTYFLPNFKTTIVYPIPYNKYLRWINSEGEITSSRKSPKVGKPIEAFKELYKIKMFLYHPNLQFKIMLIDMIEYRNLDGWSIDKKRGSSRYDRIPSELVEIIDIKEEKDYLKMIPYFDNEEIINSILLKEKAKVNISLAQVALNVLKSLNIIKSIGKKSNTIQYQINPLLKK